MKQLNRDCLILLREGTIVIDSPVSTTQKQTAWEKNLRSVMIEHLKAQLPSLDYNNKETWPQPLNGKAYQYSSRNNQVPNLPKLTSDNYRAQAIAAFLIDPQLNTVHFGEKTHWKLLLLINPLCLVCGLRTYHTAIETLRQLTHTPRSALGIELDGSDQSWHLISLPGPHAEKIGQPLPNAAHIDAGEGNIYHKSGLPAISPSTSKHLTLEDKIILTLMHQLAIIFYCETPGDLRSENGVTGFYPLSPLYLVLGMRKSLESSSQRKQDSSDPIPWTAHSEAICRLGQDKDAFLRQEALPATQQLLAFGLTMHTPMWATKTMSGELRVIQNAKIKCCQATRVDHERQMEVLRYIPADSLLRVLARGDLSEWKEKLAISDDGLKRVAVLGEKYCEYVGRS